MLTASMTNESARHPDHIGKYLVEDYLGGGMSRVYRAKDPLLRKTVAIKVLREGGSSDQAQRDRFLNEARMAASMEHPNILSVYDFGEHQGLPYMVMEFLKGENLRTIIRENRAGNLVNKLRIAQQIAKALEYIHARRIFHRDIKPENVHINASGVVKVMDFGIAKIENLGMTQPGFRIGTPYYMAPEQVQGKEATERVDIYSFGVLLYELFTGARPITGDSVEEVFYNIVHEPLDFGPLQEAVIPASLIKLISSCTAKDPAQRPQDISTICLDLEQEIEKVEASSSSTSPQRQAENFSSRRWVLACVLLVCVVTGVLAAARYLRPESAADAVQSSDVNPDLPSRLQTLSGEMILIPAGEFLSGPSQERETLPAFYIDRTEVTNAVYGRFCAATGKHPPAGFDAAADDLPVVNITIDDARQFARWAGKRLPTQKEWEKAARGTDGREYPWGNESNLSFANVSGDALAPVTGYFRGDSPWRVRQMVGNAWEFIDELSTPSSKAVANFADLLKPSPTPHEAWYRIMGGSYGEPLLPGAAYDAAFVPARFHSPRIGFRCVQDPK